jgi:class 3 adenylate cyclase
MQLDINSFHSLLDNESMLIAVHSDVVETVTQVVQETRGMCNPVLGDKFVAFWNIRIPKSDHAVMCVTAALKVRKILGEHQEKWTTSSQSTNNTTAIGVRVACTTGSALFGPMGTKTVRAFTIMSPCISRGFVLQKLAKLIPFGVVCDSGLFEYVQFQFQTRLVAVFPLSENIVERVYEVVDHSDKQKDDEWMYQLREKEAERGSKDIDFILGVRAAFTGNETSARSYFSAHIQRNPTDQLAIWYNDHISDVITSTHNKWGYSIPLKLFLTTAKEHNKMGVSSKKISA